MPQYLKESPLTMSDKLRRMIFDGVDNRSRANYLSNKATGLLDLTGATLGEDAGRMFGEGVANKSLLGAGQGLGLLAAGVVDPTKGKLGKALSSAGSAIKNNIPKGFLISTDKAPNAFVGNRYELEDMKQIVDKKILSPEDLYGSTIIPKLSDRTHRGQLVRSVSGQELKNPVLSKGGFQYPRDVDHLKNNVMYASNSGAAKVDIDRLKSAYDSNIAMGGKGDVYLAPVPMGAGSEYFGGMTSDVLENFVDNGKMTKALSSELDDEMRKGVGGLKPLPGWSGIMTKEGRDQLQKEGKYRVAFSKRMENQKYQKALGYNYKDIEGALIDPDLKGLPNYTVGDTLIKVKDPNLLRLQDGLHPAYNKDIIGGNYVGGLLGGGAPITEFYGDDFMAQLLTGKIPNQTTLTKDYTKSKSVNPYKDALGALFMTKDGSVAGKYMDEQSVDKLIKYQKYLKTKGLLGD